MTRRSVLVSLFVFILGARCLVANGAGLYFFERGARPAGRGGAFVAGADDLNALSYNPAGLTEFESEIAFDAGLPMVSVEYSRVGRYGILDAQTNSPSGKYSQVSYDTVQGSTLKTPIPFGAISKAFLENRLHVAAGFYTPYIALFDYSKGKADTAPQRYALVSLDGSLLTKPGVYAAYAFTENLSVGVGASAVVGKVRAQLALSATLPNRTLCSSEDPDCDVMAYMEAKPIFSPTGNIGVLYKMPQEFRVGISWEAPTFIDSKAEMGLGVPAHPLFRNAYQNGTSSQFKMTLPWILRAGLEWRRFENRIEIAGSFEAWSMQKNMEVLSKDVSLKNIALVSTYELGDLKIQRAFRNAWSVRLGAERKGQALGGFKSDIRAGVAYERSAVPRDFVSSMTFDADKIPLSLGAGVYFGRVRADIAYSHVFSKVIKVNPESAKVVQVNPVRSSDSSQATQESINGGSYKVNANLLALGINYTL